MQRADHINSSSGQKTAAINLGKDIGDDAVRAFAAWHEIEAAPVPATATEADDEAWIARSVAAEFAVVVSAARTPAGLAAKLRLVVAAEGSNNHDVLISQVIAGLDAMALAA